MLTLAAPKDKCAKECKGGGSFAGEKSAGLTCHECRKPRHGVVLNCRGKSLDAGAGAGPTNKATQLNYASLYAPSNPLQNGKTLAIPFFALDNDESQSKKVREKEAEGKSSYKRAKYKGQARTNVLGIDRDKILSRCNDAYRDKEEGGCETLGNIVYPKCKPGYRPGGGSFFGSYKCVGDGTTPFRVLHLELGDEAMPMWPGGEWYEETMSAAGKPMRTIAKAKGVWLRNLALRVPRRTRKQDNGKPWEEDPTSVTCQALCTELLKVGNLPEGIDSGDGGDGGADGAAAPPNFDLLRASLRAKLGLGGEDGSSISKEVENGDDGDAAFPSAPSDAEVAEELGDDGPDGDGSELEGDVAAGEGEE
jgi:hypothetical protein